MTGDIDVIREILKRKRIKVRVDYIDYFKKWSVSLYERSIAGFEVWQEVKTFKRRSDAIRFAKKLLKEREKALKSLKLSKEVKR